MEAASSAVSWMWSGGTTWQEDIMAAEKALLDSAPMDGVTWDRADVPIDVDGEPHSIHHIVATTDDSPSRPIGTTQPLVLWHGFGQVFVMDRSTFTP